MRFVLILLTFVLSFSELHARKRKRKKIRQVAPLFQLKDVSIVSAENPDLCGFLARLKKITVSGSPESILIIGDSHQQCEDFGISLTRYLKDSAGVPLSGRNFVFPYPLARTSHRSNERFRCLKSEWKGCRATNPSASCQWGISGWLAESAADSLRFSWTAETPFAEGDEIGILSHQEPDAYRLFLEDSTGKTEIPYNSERSGYFCRIGNSCKRLVFSGIRSNSAQSFHHQGFMRSPAKPGLSLGITGTNGARLDHYLMHPDFDRHLKLLNPGMVVLALGTNDAFMYPFDPDIIRKHLGMLVSRIKMVLPDAAILIVGPPDHCRRKGRVNPNTKQVCKVFSEMAEELELGFWNQQEAMGGEGSALAWRRKKLITTDMVHFTMDGYALQGRMLGRALLKALPTEAKP